MSMPEGIIVYDKDEPEPRAKAAINKSQTESVYSLQSGLNPDADSQVKIGVTFFNQSAEKLTGLNFHAIMKQLADPRGIYEQEEVDKFEQKNYAIQVETATESSDFENFISSSTNVKVSNTEKS